MKKFLLKVSIYAAALLVAISLICVYYYRKVPPRFLLVSNSASYNLKAGFVQEHPEKLDKAGIVVVGSSMSLNNVNGRMLQDSLHLRAVNLSSWGMRIAVYEHSPIWNMHKIFLSNLGVADFGAPGVEPEDNFSFHTSKAQEMFNLGTNFSTFLGTLEVGNKVMSIRDNRDYQSCNFDETGSVVFSDSAFAIDSVRWNSDEYARWSVDSAKMKDYVRRLKEITSSHQGYERIVLSFSPVRRVFYNKKRSGMVAYLGRMIRDSCPNVAFINLYDRDYPDSIYVDNSHFNRKGANRYTRELVDSMRILGIQGNGE